MKGASIGDIRDSCHIAMLEGIMLYTMADEAVRHQIFLSTPIPRNRIHNGTKRSSQPSLELFDSGSEATDNFADASDLVKFGLQFIDRL